MGGTAARRGRRSTGAGIPLRKPRRQEIGQFGSQTISMALDRTPKRPKDPGMIGGK